MGKRRPRGEDLGEAGLIVLRHLCSLAVGVRLVFFKLRINDGPFPSEPAAWSRFPWLACPPGLGS
jgi:hypothetical protein